MGQMSSKMPGELWTGYALQAVEQVSDSIPDEQADEAKRHQPEIVRQAGG